MEKVCSKCNILKDVINFSQARKRTGGYGPWCKICCCQYRKENRERYNKSLRNWKGRNPDKVRDSALLRYYGITLSDYNLMLTKQDFACAICKTTEPKTPKQALGVFCVDHCHSSGKVRGLLCFNCNTGLGQFKDNVNVLKESLRYLERNK